MKLYSGSGGKEFYFGKFLNEPDNIGFVPFAGFIFRFTFFHPEISPVTAWEVNYNNRSSTKYSLRYFPKAKQKETPYVIKKYIKSNVWLLDINKTGYWYL